MRNGYKLAYLLVFLLLILLLYPVFEGRTRGGNIFALFFTGVLITGVYAVSRGSKKILITSLALSIPALLLMWLDQFYHTKILDAVSYAFMSAFSFYIVGCLIMHIIRTKKITGDILAGAASAYLLLGIAWGLLYAFLQVMIPGSFIVEGGIEMNPDTKWSLFNYYSFTTLTTLGYGDITPANTRAQSLAILEAVTGVFFLAILISSLIGSYTYSSREGNESNK